MYQGTLIIRWGAILSTGLIIDHFPLLVIKIIDGCAKRFDEMFCFAMVTKMGDKKLKLVILKLDELNI